MTDPIPEAQSHRYGGTPSRESGWGSTSAIYADADICPSSRSSAPRRSDRPSPQRSVRSSSAGSRRTATPLGIPRVSPDHSGAFLVKFEPPETCRRPDCRENATARFAHGQLHQTSATPGERRRQSASSPPPGVLFMPLSGSGSFDLRRFRARCHCCRWRVGRLRCRFNRCDGSSSRLRLPPHTWWTDLLTRLSREHRMNGLD